MNASNKIVCEKATTRLKYEMKMFPAPAVATNEPSLIMNLEQIRLYCRKKTTSNKRSSPFCPFNINIPVKGICLAPKVKSYFNGGQDCNFASPNEPLMKESNFGMRKVRGKLFLSMTVYSYLKNIIISWEYQKEHTKLTDQ